MCIFKKLYLVLIFAVLFSVSLFSQADLMQNQVFLWKGIAPGSENLKIEEQILERSKTPDVFDRAILGITKPSIITMFPEKSKANGVAVLICPGGAYQRVVVDKEGYDVGKWLNSLGITAFILKYRLPGEGHKDQFNVPLQDAQRAMRLIKKNASKWNLDENKIGVAGFSAGGHVATTLATKYSSVVYKPVDDADKLDAKPYFVILGYPVVSMKDGITHKVTREMLLGKTPSQELINTFSNELNINNNTPQTFIFLARDDSSVPHDNSYLFYSGLKSLNINTELHIFKESGHGFGIRGAKTTAALWTKLCEEWMNASGILTNK